jgi:hypothetical protein
MTKQAKKSNAGLTCMLDVSLTLLTTFIAISDVKPEYDIILPSTQPISKNFTFVSYDKNNKNDFFILKNNHWVEEAIPKQHILIPIKDKNYYGIKPIKPGYEVKGLVFGEELSNFSYQYLLLGKGLKKLNYEIK